MPTSPHGISSSNDPESTLVGLAQRCVTTTKFSSAGVPPAEESEEGEIIVEIRGRSDGDTHSCAS